LRAADSAAPPSLRPRKHSLATPRCAREAGLRRRHHPANRLGMARDSADDLRLRLGRARSRGGPADTRLRPFVRSARQAATRTGLAVRPGREAGGSTPAAGVPNSPSPGMARAGSGIPPVGSGRGASSSRPASSSSILSATSVTPAARSCRATPAGRHRRTCATWSGTASRAMARRATPTRLWRTRRAAPSSHADGMTGTSTASSSPLKTPPNLPHWATCAAFREKWSGRSLLGIQSRKSGNGSRAAFATALSVGGSGAKRDARCFDLGESVSVDR
jgi:hypothetical protein